MENGEWNTWIDYKCVYFTTSVTQFYVNSQVWIMVFCFYFVLQTNATRSKQFQIQQSIYREMQLPPLMLFIRFNFVKFYNSLFDSFYVYNQAFLL